MPQLEVDVMKLPILIVLVSLIFSIAPTTCGVLSAQEEEPAAPSGEAVARSAGEASARSTGDAAARRAVDAGLDWLARHQHPEGYWDADAFADRCSGEVRCSGKGQALNDVGVTGLAMLAFLGRGNTLVAGPHKRVLKRGTKYLCDVMDAETGCLVPQEGTAYMYNHAIGTLALCETYGLSKWPILKKQTQRAIDFIHRSKNPGMAWRYNLGELDPADRNDTSVTGWMILCLTAAHEYGLRVDREDVKDALAFLDLMTDPETGRTGYRERGSYAAREAGDEAVWPYDQTESMTAVAMLGRVFAGRLLGDLDAQRKKIAAGAALVRKVKPAWDLDKGCIDYFYWYFGSLAMRQVGGRDRAAWKAALIAALLPEQKTKGCERGSWKPHLDPWGDCGGRVYATAMLTLCLEAMEN